MNSDLYGSNMYEINKIISEINKLSYSLNNSVFFSSINLRPPSFRDPELSFIQIVSFFYVLCYEVGRANIIFLNDYINNNLNNSIAIDYYKLISNLRTFLQHNIELKQFETNNVFIICNDWFRNACKTSLPSTDDEWEQCLNHIILESTEFLKLLKECIKRIEQSPDRNQIIESWKIKANRYIPPHIFDEIISETANDLGRDSIDYVKFRKKYYSQFSKKLELYQGNTDFKTEARKLIEKMLIKDLSILIPITGKDIIQTLNVTPGPVVGELLSISYEIFEKNNNCSKDMLLHELQKAYKKMDK